MRGSRVQTPLLPPLPAAAGGLAVVAGGTLGCTVFEGGSGLAGGFFGKRFWAGLLEPVDVLALESYALASSSSARSRTSGATEDARATRSRSCRRSKGSGDSRAALIISSAQRRSISTRSADCLSELSTGSSSSFRCAPTTSPFAINARASPTIRSSSLTTCAAAGAAGVGVALAAEVGDGLAGASETCRRATRAVTMPATTKTRTALTASLRSRRAPRRERTMGSG